MAKRPSAEETPEPASRDGQPDPAPPAAPAPPAGRRLTLQEKLAAARSGGASAAAPAAAEPAAAPPPAVRVLPPIDELNDPRDVAEALRQVGARKIAEAAEVASGG